jgi:hypothetical protein
MKLQSAPRLDAAVRAYPVAQESAVTPAEEFRAPLEPAAVRSIIAGIMLAMFLSALEQTIIAPALPTIGPPCCSWRGAGSEPCIQSPPC